MKFRKPKLHIQILLGLILGAFFGSVFHIDTHKVLITYQENGELIETEIRNWKKIELQTDDETREFKRDDQLPLLKSFRKSKEAKKRIDVTVFLDDGIRKFQYVEAVSKEQTIAVAIKPIGDIFIRLLMMIAIPLVFASLVVGVASLHDIGKMARIGGKTIAYYLTTTAFAITLGLIIGNTVQPGHRMDDAARDRLLAVYEQDAAMRIEQKVTFNIVEYLVNLVPKNPVAALTNGEMLPIIFFALMLGVALLFIQREKADRITGFFDAVADGMIKMVDLVMLIAPFGVFALISAVVGEFGFGIIQTLLWYILAVLIGLIIQTFVVYPVFLKLFGNGTSILKFLRAMRPVHLVAFTTSSSAATLPVNFEYCEKLGAPKSVTGFVLPLGATINMDGTALYQGVATLFIAQVYGMDLTIAQQLSVVLTATFASIGTAPVPGVGIIMLIIVLKSVGIPEEGIALILGVDRILDMCRTITNVTGDATATMIISSTEGVLGKE